MDFPFRAEYAKSGRASCRSCKKTIDQGALRLAALVQSPMFDGKQAQWYHVKCFFIKQRPKTVDDIEHFESLRVEDQDKLKKNIISATAVIPDKKGKKRTGDSGTSAALKDYKIEYAKSGRAMCRGCEQKILKDEIRISKKDFDTDVGRKYGGQDMWHHVTCFAQIRSELGYFECGDKIPGFKGLKKEDQADVKKQIPAIKQEDVPEVKKLKTEDAVDGGSEEKEYRKQNKMMYKYRDELQEHLSQKELVELLEYNNQKPSVGKESLLDQLSDAMTFGKLDPCPKCTDGQLSFNKVGYICKGNLTEWTKCLNVVKEPKRGPFQIPKSFKEDYPFLKKYKYVPRTRIVKEVHTTTELKKDVKEEPTEPKVKRALPPLYDMEFVIIGNPPSGKEAIKKQVSSMGGKVTTKLSESVLAVISTPEDVEKMGSRMQEVEALKIHVVPEDFLNKAKDSTGKIPDLVIEKSICNWGTDPTARMPSEPSTSSIKSKSRSAYTKSGSGKVKLKVKGGGAVDPDSGLEDVAYVYQEGKEKYTVTLGITDIQTNKNSYYKLQLLAADNGNKYWVFRSWGRIGTTIGGTKVDSMGSLHEAKKLFKVMYEEKTGGVWENHHCFVKVPGKMYPIDVDYGEPDVNLDIVEAESKLAKPVQDLIRMIFDVNSMKKLMAEFELDTEKMPLGKLSDAQIHKAFAVLNELKQLIDSNNPDETRLLDASNRFYTFIPHSFGINDPPILRDDEVITQKLEMLDSLKELEIAYNLMKSSGSEHTVDSYYKQLNAEIDVLDKKSEEFAVIQEYLENTHAATHSNYTLEIEDVYTVKRQGEEKRFKPFRKLPNHKLLWHGSRVTNFAGILSQGLRIAPPEAPVTGYMFGKGIYFADMVSKSANYCCTSPMEPKGLLMLCDVALGNMYELTHSKYIEKLPKGKHSTKGLGRTEPDPAGAKSIGGIEVPAGKGVENSVQNSALLYNEYIVYDVAQVNVKYLLKVNFKYKY